MICRLIWFQADRPLTGSFDISNLGKMSLRKFQGEQSMVANLFRRSDTEYDGVVLLNEYFVLSHVKKKWELKTKVSRTSIRIPMLWKCDGNWFEGGT